MCVRIPGLMCESARTRARCDLEFGTVGGLLEGAAAAVTNVAGSEGTTQLSQSCQ